MIKTFYICLVCLIIMSFIGFFLIDDKNPKVLIFSTDLNQIRDEQIDLFREMYPEIPIATDPTKSDDAMKIIVQSVGGVGPDLLTSYNPEILTAYVKAGIALDITDIIKEWGVDYKKDFWPSTFDTSIYEDRIYGVPGNASVDGIWYNKTLFDEAGVEYPSGEWDWNEFIEIALKLTKVDEDGKVTQFGFGLDWGDQWPLFVKQWNGEIFNEDGTECTLNSPEVIEAVQFLHDLMYKYKVIPTPIEESGMVGSGGWGGGPINFFGGGRYAMALGGRWWKISFQNFPDLNYGVSQTPYNSRKVFYGAGKSVLINKNSPRKDEAFDFLKYLLSKEYNMLINLQGDAFSGVKKYTELTPEELENPLLADIPMWAGMMEHAEAMEMSPFVDTGYVKTKMNDQLTLVKNNIRTPEEAMNRVTEQVNKRIQEYLQEDPGLRKQYEELTGRKVK